MHIELDITGSKIKYEDSELRFILFCFHEVLLQVFCGSRKGVYPKRIFLYHCFFNPWWNDLMLPLYMFKLSKTDLKQFYLILSK